jgi:hypothetical protein
MTIPRICALFLASPLAFTIACGGGARHYTQKHPEIHADSVTINNCDANPDTVDVYDGQTLTWTVDPTDSNTYTIAFGDSRPVSPKSSDASHASPDAQKIQKDSWCKYAGWVHEGYCKYDYTLSKKGSSTPCPDPGIHIIPGG